MQAAANDKDRVKLFAAANNGEVSVIFGSTAKLGTRVNVQKLALVEHYSDEEIGLHCSDKSTEKESVEAEAISPRYLN